MYVERAPECGATGSEGQRAGEQTLQRGPGHVHREWLSRGDTPKHEIKCVHKAKTLAAQRLEDSSRPRPYDHQEGVVFPSRDQGMYLEVLRPGDAPKGTVRYPKAFDRALMADDIPLATPTLSHAAVGSCMPVPFGKLHPAERAEVEGSRPKEHYPEVRKAQDLSLNVRDIEGAQPKKMGHYVRYNRQHEENNPVQPYYATLSSENPAALEPRPPATGRLCSLDVSDVEGARPQPALPPRAAVTDVLRCEPEFQSRARAAAATRAEASREPTLSSSLGWLQRPVTPGRTARPRGTCPQDPTYSVALPAGGRENTSLACRYSEEEGSQIPAMEHQLLGPVEGSQPRLRARNLTKPIFGLEARDIEGAQAVRRVGGKPFSAYGPESNKEKSRSLATADIPGAQAGTLKRGLQGPASARATTGAGATIALASTSGGAFGGGADFLAERQRKDSLWLPASSAALLAAERGDPPAAVSTARQWAPPTAGRGRSDCPNDGGLPQAGAATIKSGALTAR